MMGYVIIDGFDDVVVDYADTLATAKIVANRPNRRIYKLIR